MRSTLTALHNYAAHRDLWRLAAPMMLSNVSIAVLGLVDTAVIGHLENASYLAGIALASVLFDFLYWGVTFLRMGTTGVAAQENGANDERALRATLRDALTIALAIAGAILLFREPVLKLGLAMLGGSDVAGEHATQFFRIKIWGAPGVLVTMVCIGWLIGTQQARFALVLAALPCLLHAGLDVLFVVVLKMSIVGAAYAALCSAYFSAILGFFLVWRVLRRYSASDPISWELARLRRLLALNSNILIRTLCLIASFAFFTQRSALQGDTVLAANTLLLNFQLLTALALDGFANALEALVGAAVGARDRTRFVTAVVVGSVWSIAFAVLLVMLYALGGAQFLAVLTDLDNVRETAAQYLIWAVILPAISVTCFIFDGIFIGATKAREMRNSMLIAAFGVFIPAWYIFEPLANHGLWLAFTLFFAARGLSMGFYFRRLDRQRAFTK